MNITVEFFGIPRERAGVESCCVVANTLGELLLGLSHSFPDFAKSCMLGDELMTHTLANINGQHFTRDIGTPLNEGDHVLILSADVGG